MVLQLGPVGSKDTEGASGSHLQDRGCGQASSSQVRGAGAMLLLARVRRGACCVPMSLVLRRARDGAHVGENRVKNR